METVTPPRKDARRRLLAAALAVIRGKGFAAASVDELCRVAGVTKGAFFHHFRSKEDLAVAAAAYFATMADGLFEAPWTQLPTPAERVLGYVALRRDIIGGPFESFTCLLGTMVQEAYATSDPIRAACEAGILGHAFRLLPDLTAALAAAGRDDISPESLALHIQAVLQGGFILAKATGDPARARATVDHLIRYLASLFAMEGRPMPVSPRRPFPTPNPGDRFMSYVDGFVCPVPLANKEAYRKHATVAAAMFREHGALQVVEAWADDVPEGKITSFTMAVKREDDEATVFSWIVWPSREARDAGWEKVMKDDRMPQDVSAMPFDARRMIYGGFSPIVEV